MSLEYRLSVAVSLTPLIAVTCVESETPRIPHSDWNVTMVKLISVTPQVGDKLHLEYDDGEIGDVDVSDLIGKGVFTAWSDTAVFAAVRIGEHGRFAGPRIWSCV